ncbi:hypothetical protein SUS17_2008 [Sphingomonas sp. S17]|nr:hypothetical protein SUS17_2008 [Sphingomonas sp. S17]
MIEVPIAVISGTIFLPPLRTAKRLGFHRGAAWCIHQPFP